MNISNLQCKMFTLRSKFKTNQKRVASSHSPFVHTFDVSVSLRSVTIPSSKSVSLLGDLLFRLVRSLLVCTISLKSTS